jgi:hypothetical protein
MKKILTSETNGQSCCPVGRRDSRDVMKHGGALEVKALHRHGDGGEETVELNFKWRTYRIRA